MNMDHLYNVIWADDEVDALLQDSESRFQKYGISIIPFHDATSAIEYVKTNSSFVDALIVDGKFPSTEGEAVQEEGRSFPGLSKFMRELSSLRRETGQPLPCWIYTGYGSLLLDKYDEADLDGFEGVVDKKSDRETTREWLTGMCERIAETKTESFRIRQENPEIFALCSDRYLGKSTERVLLDILSYKKDDETEPFNRFRDILEEVMDLLVKESIIGGSTQKTAINDRIDKLDKAFKGKLPQYIIHSLKLLLSSSALSHSGTTEKKEVEEGRAPYMYETLEMTLKTVLIWLRSFVDNNRTKRERQNVANAELASLEQKEMQPAASAPANAPSDQTKPFINDPSLEGTEVGFLSVKTWSVRVGSTYAQISRDRIERSWKPGLRIRVRLGKNYKGDNEVVEVIGIEP